MYVTIPTCVQSGSRHGENRQVTLICPFLWLILFLSQLDLHAVSQPHRHPLLFACNLCIQTRAPNPRLVPDTERMASPGALLPGFPAQPPAREARQQTCACQMLFSLSFPNLPILAFYQIFYLSSKWTKIYDVNKCKGDKKKNEATFFCFPVLVSVPWRDNEKRLSSHPPFVRCSLSSALFPLHSNPPIDPPTTRHPPVSVFESVVWLCAPPASHCSAN